MVGTVTTARGSLALSPAMPVDQVSSSLSEGTPHTFPSITPHFCSVPSRRLSSSPVVISESQPLGTVLIHSP